MKYQWLKRLIQNKITHKDFDLNNEFFYYGHYVVCSSDKFDYVTVEIDNMYRFSFDFLTKDLYFYNEIVNTLFNNGNAYLELNYTHIIIRTLQKIYNSNWEEVHHHHI